MENTPATASPQAYINCLRVNRIRLSVRLGVTDEERRFPQAVEVDTVFYFPAVTEASRSDAGPFICYDNLGTALVGMCKAREFSLIEYLCMECYAVARNSAPPEVKIAMRVTKCDVPVPFPMESASFTYTDLPPFSWTPPL